MRSCEMMRSSAGDQGGSAVHQGGSRGAGEERGGVGGVDDLGFPTFLVLLSSCNMLGRTSTLRANSLAAVEDRLRARLALFLRSFALPAAIALGAPSVDLSVPNDCNPNSKLSRAAARRLLVPRDPDQLPHARLRTLAERALGGRLAGCG